MITNQIRGFNYELDNENIKIRETSRILVLVSDIRNNPGQYISSSRWLRP